MADERYTSPMDRFLKSQSQPSAFIDHLRKRELLQDLTPALGDYLANCEATGHTPRAYIGFDPSGSSLQLGNLLAVMLLRRAQLHGIQPLILVGGATGLIGDPSGKKEERTLLSQEAVQANLVKIKEQLGKLVDLEEGKFQGLFVNNFDWFKDFSYLDFLREVGKHITVNYMTAKDSVKIRMETGISYAEFGYMLVQGYDFLHLFEKFDCRLQMGGSDQWGNMTTGLELIRRKHGKEGYALSSPLLTDGSGAKLGKTEKGAIYLDEELTPPFRFYQYLLQQPDGDCPRLLRALTLLNDTYLQELLSQHEKAPEQRAAQKILAHELTRLIHGEEAALAAENASKVLFSKDAKMLDGLSKKGLELLAQEVPCSKLTEKTPLVDLLVQTGLCSSKGDARRQLKSGAIHLNREKIADEGAIIDPQALFSQRRAALLGLGKSNLHLLLPASI
jgi:tyrosyl-tRNA synthetase